MSFTVQRGISVSGKYDFCPACSSSIHCWRNKRVGDIEYRIEKCTSCGYAFVNPRPTLKFLIDYYLNTGHGQKDKCKLVDDVLNSEKQYPNSTIDAQRIIKTIELMNLSIESKAFLDVGCGYGFFAREAIINGYDVVALELASEERHIAKQVAGLEPISTSFENFTHSNNSFSVILMSQILEHAFDVNLWISKAKELLVTGGVLAVALPNFHSIFRKILQEKDPYICPPDHLNFFGPRSITTLLKKHGFNVLEIQWVSRIPLASLERRFSFLGENCIAIVSKMTNLTLMVIDGFHLGMIMNVYAKKVVS